MTLLQKKTLLLAIACALFALLALTACGGGSSDESGDDAPDSTADSSDGGDDGGDDGEDTVIDACALLATDEVEAALGKPVGAPTPSNHDPYFECIWATDDGDDVTVTIQIGANPDLEFYFDLTPNPEPIEGLGDRAQYSEVAGLEVLTDGQKTIVKISSTTLDDAAIKEQTLLLGENVIARLG